MTPVIILVENCKYVVFPTMEKPKPFMGGGQQGYEHDLAEYNDHVARLPRFPLDPSLQHLEPGEMKGYRGQWQWRRWPKTSQWFNCTQVEAESNGYQYTRIIPVKIEGEKLQEKVDEYNNYCQSKVDEYLNSAHPTSQEVEKEGIGPVFSCILKSTGETVWKFWYNDSEGLNQHSGVYFKEEYARKGYKDFIASQPPQPGRGEEWISLEEYKGISLERLKDKPVIKMLLNNVNTPYETWTANIHSLIDKELGAKREVRILLPITQPLTNEQ